MFEPLMSIANCTLALGTSYHASAPVRLTCMQQKGRISATVNFTIFTVSISSVEEALGSSCADRESDGLGETRQSCS